MKVKESNKNMKKNIVNDFISDINSYLIDSLETIKISYEFAGCNAGLHIDQNRRWHIYHALITSSITNYGQYWYAISNKDRDSPWHSKKINNNDVECLKNKMIDFVEIGKSVLEKDCLDIHEKIIIGSYKDKNIKSTRTHRVHSTMIIGDKFYETSVLFHNKKKVNVYRAPKHVGWGVDGDFTYMESSSFQILLEKTILELNTSIQD